jgi:acetyltransferase-like isoleucine patch superfamily enzyme
MQGFERGRIHPTAIVSESARLAPGVTIGAGVIVYDHVTIGEGTIVGPHSILGEPTADYYEHGDAYVNRPLIIGRSGVIRSGTIIYAGSEIGEQFTCGHRVTIRENTRLGSHGRVGTLSDIQGHCVIGDYARIHSNVHIGQAAEIGNFVWIYPYSALINDPQPPSTIVKGVVVEDFAVLATHVLAGPGVRIGRGALVGARSFVTSDVPADVMALGSPARVVCHVSNIPSATAGEPAYPWREHFEREMPWAGIGYHAWQARRGSS